MRPQTSQAMKKSHLIRRKVDLYVIVLKDQYIKKNHYKDTLKCYCLKSPSIENRSWKFGYLLFWGVFFGAVYGNMAVSQ